MRRIIYVLPVLFGVACSSPKYTASFNQYDPQTGYHPVKTEAQVKTVNPEPVLASTSSAPVELKAEPQAEVRKTYLQMDKTERKALRTQLRSDIKSFVKDQKKNMGVESVSATKGMDNDLKLAAVFGAVGIVALIIGGDVFWIIGGIAMLIGVVFFVKWLLRQ